MTDLTTPQLLACGITLLLVAVVMFCFIGIATGVLPRRRPSDDDGYEIED